MRKFIKHRASRKAGLPPGSLSPISEAKQEDSKITLIKYNQDFFEEKELKEPEDIFNEKTDGFVVWLNIDGLGNMDVIKKIGDGFKIHPLVLEDIVHVDQRTKFEEYENYIYIVLKMMSSQGQNGDIDAEQVSILFFGNMIISFQERTGDVFSPLRERMRTSKGRIRSSEADYLMYCLLDSIVDNYFIILEKVGEKIDYLEEGLVVGADSKKLMIIHNLKRQMIFLRKAVWPLREVVNGLIKEEAFIKRGTEIYLRDVYDHTIQVIDTIESLRDMASGLLDIYMTSIGNRMNEIMKVLTVLASIFIPLTFIAGVYGMNFEYMPELKWKFGYFAVLGMMGLIAVAMVIFFRKKRWL